MEPESLPDDIRRLLDAERDSPPLPSGAEARMWARLAPLLPVQLPQPNPGPKAAQLLTLGGMKLPLIAAFVLGGAAGAALHAALQPEREVAPIAREPVPPQPAPPPPRPVERAHQAIPPEPTSAQVKPPSPAQAKPAPAQRVGPAPTPPTSSLDAEEALIDMGRTALARGAYDAAYRAMVEHERLFPSGQLAEERDAVRVQALAGKGQLEAARQKAKAFRARYPHSLLMPAVERALVTESGAQP